MVLAQSKPSQVDRTVLTKVLSYKVLQPLHLVVRFTTQPRRAILQLLVGRITVYQGQEEERIKTRIGGEDAGQILRILGFFPLPCVCRLLFRVLYYLQQCLLLRFKPIDLLHARLVGPTQLEFDDLLNLVQQLLNKHLTVVIDGL